MGSNQSSEKLYCNRFLDGNGPPSLVQQANAEVNGIYKVLSGTQPPGQMTWVILHRDLPGHPIDNTLQINYIFPGGIQTDKHPPPGASLTQGCGSVHYPAGQPRRPEGPQAAGQGLQHGAAVLCGHQ
ncbi:probable E3 ubiquitin-protein ligase DTX2 [Gymnodraco acuticeps]|uniref:E3 ubiquitin-protein ligase n=1 Tax=Gymnodraco acuticeps TaxID=8218 RepID=A0A6P8TR36_GYMAC|nr:probable E3 ubiquitin-protein ligase DTX2 [Gymnodraco acuticeps]